MKIGLTQNHHSFVAGCFKNAHLLDVNCAFFTILRRALAILRKSCLLVTILMAGQASAKSWLGCLQMDPYLGVEYQYQHIKGNDDWHLILPANFSNGAVFLGNKFHPNFGVEVGYYHYLKTSQAANSLESFQGQTASGQTEVFTRMNNQGFSVDVAGYLPLDYRFRVFALIGLVTYHPMLTITTEGGSDLAAALPLVQARNNTVLRLGCGAEYTEKNWGVRARLLWDQTNKVKFNVDNATPLFAAINSNIWQQSILVTVGVFLRF